MAKGGWLRTRGFAVTGLSLCLYIGIAFPTIQIFHDRDHQNIINSQGTLELKRHLADSVGIILHSGYSHLSNTPCQLCLIQTTKKFRSGIQEFHWRMQFVENLALAASRYIALKDPGGEHSARAPPQTL